MDKGRILLTRILPTSDSLVDNTVSSDEEDGSQATSESQTTQCCYNDFLQLLEILLSFHAWYKSTKPIQWDSDSKHIINKSIQSMLKQIKSVFPRKDVNG
jgi:glutathionyl-hydroquinone reductase